MSLKTKEAPASRVSKKTRDFIAKPKKLLIGGDWQKSANGKTFDSFDPSSGEVLARVAEGEAEDINLAVAAARRAFDQGPWRKMTSSDRSRIIWKIGDLILEHL